MQDFFFVWCDKKYVKIKFAELIFVRARRNYMQMVTETKTYLVLAKMDMVKQYLPKDRFCRIHRSYFVALDRVQAYDDFTIWLTEPDEGSKCRPGLACTKSLPLSNNFRKSFKQSVIFMPGAGARDINLLQQMQKELAEEEALFDQG
jgi:DNA-binding LytR/AlgR family response regulator